MKNEISKRPLLEVCVDSLASVHEAIAGGADRIELCAHLKSGGLTPSYALLKLAIAQSSIPVHVLVRPRAGDFCYSKSEIEVIHQEIEFIKSAGASGVVCGFLLPDGQIDHDLTHSMVKYARPMSFTFHRAFDFCRDADEGLQSIITAGCDRLLTSGQKNVAIEGRDMIARLINQAKGRILIMPGSGINADNIEVLLETGASEFHMSGRIELPGAHFENVNGIVLDSNPDNDSQIFQTSQNKISEVSRILRRQQIA